MIPVHTSFCPQHGNVERSIIPYLRMWQKSSEELHSGHRDTIRDDQDGAYSYARVLCHLSSLVYGYLEGRR